MQKICQACGHPATRQDPVIRVEGHRIHRSHTTDPKFGFYRGRKGR